MVMSVGLIAGITAGGTFAVGLVLSAALIWHLWVRQSQQGDKDVERGQGGSTAPCAFEAFHNMCLLASFQEAFQIVWCFLVVADSGT